MANRYSFKERLAHGPAWDLKNFGGSRDGVNYAPKETRADFQQVVADCTVMSIGSAPSEPRGSAVAVVRKRVDAWKSELTSKWNDGTSRG